MNFNEIMSNIFDDPTRLLELIYKNLGPVFSNQIKTKLEKIKESEEKNDNESNSFDMESDEDEIQ